MGRYSMSKGQTLCLGTVSIELWNLKLRSREEKLNTRCVMVIFCTQIGWVTWLKFLILTGSSSLVSRHFSGSKAEISSLKFQLNMRSSPVLKIKKYTKDDLKIFMMNLLYFKGKKMLAIEKELGCYWHGQHFIRLNVEYFLADRDESTMWTMEELTELIESDTSLQWLTLTVLDAFHLQFERLGRQVAQPEDQLERLALYLSYWNDENMVMLLAIRAEFLVEPVGSWTQVSLFVRAQQLPSYPVISKLSQ